MLNKHSLIWATGLTALFIIVLAFWIPFKEAAKFALVIYFLIYLPGYFFLRNFYESENALEQNSLSVTMGMVILAILSFVVKELRIIYNKATIIILAFGIISVSLLWEQARKRKNHGASRRTK